MASDAFPTTPALREASKAAFGRSSQIEVALVVASFESTFVFDDVYELVVERSRTAGLDPPGQSAVRTDLARLRTAFKAVEVLPTVRGDQLQRHVRKPSPIWDLCLDLAAKVESASHRA